MGLKIRKCRQCGEEYRQTRPLQVICSFGCAAQYARKQEEKKERKETAEKKKELLTHKDYLKMLQVIFNTYIRERDKGKPCISCPRTLTGKYDAGHYFSVGGNPGMRFDEENVHGQCVYCNQHNHGNILEYQKGLAKRIGFHNYCQLVNRKNGQHHKLSIPEIKEMISEYRFKVKQLKK